MKTHALTLSLMLCAATSFAATPAATTTAPASPMTHTTGMSTTLQTPTSTATATIPGSEATAAVTATCGDGSAFSGATRKGACSSHKGAKTWTGSNMTPTAMANTSDSAKTAAQKSSAPLPTAAAGGGAGKVWVNEKSNKYHCQTDRFYGKTKTGAYMTEAEAQAKGAHTDHGKACA
jgi:hypothetical protein